MAVYKVIQDIESEDKLLGPLTLKGFVYVAIAGVLAFVNVRLLIAGGPIYLKLPVIFVLFLPMLLFGVLASPLGRDQPTEVWLLSHIRFLLKARLRTWDQSGTNDLVTITAPKHVDTGSTKGFSQNEVQSRLQALATTLDSRGWAVKNSAVNLSTHPGYLGGDDGASDRLIAPASVTQASQVIDVHASDDILDEQNNATAQHFNELMQVADSQRKQAIVDKIDAARQAETVASGATDTSFLDASTRSGNTTFVGHTVVAPHAETDQAGAVSNEQLPPEAAAALERAHQRAADIHRRSAGFKPSRASRKAAEKARAAAERRRIEEENARQQTVTATPVAAKLELAQSGNDLSVASIAHLAKHAGQARQIGPGEVEVALH